MAKWCWEDQAATSGKVCLPFSGGRHFKGNFHKQVDFWSPSSGQVISAAKEDIIRTYYPGYFMQSVDNQIQTKQVQAAHDDSYQGETNRNAFIQHSFAYFPPPAVTHLRFHSQATLLLSGNSAAITSKVSPQTGRVSSC